MDITRKQFTNVEPGKDALKGSGQYVRQCPGYPPADFKGVVRSNFDTLYSSAWLDMSKEPVVISVPDTDGRYYLAANARYVEQCLCVAGLAHDRHQGRDVPDHAAELAA